MKHLAQTAIFALIVAGVISGVQAQPTPPGPPYFGRDFSKIDVKVTDLGHQTYQLEGAGGNTTIAIGSDAVIVVDSQFAPMHDKLKAAIAQLTDKPVKYLIDTHYHPDHTDGNALFGKEGAIVVAQDNVKTRMVNRTPLANNTVPGPWPPEGMPAQTFSDKTTISIAGRAPVQIVHVVPSAHTDGDSYVFFPDADVLVTGDVTTGATGYPAPDPNNGGNVNGIISAYETFLKAADDQTKVVSGHGPLATRADLQKTHDFLVMVRDRIAKLKASGMSEDQVIAAKPLADVQAQRQANDAASERYVRMVYKDIR